MVVSLCREETEQVAACQDHTVVSTFGTQMSYQGCEFGGSLSLSLGLYAYMAVLEPNPLGILGAEREWD